MGSPSSINASTTACRQLSRILIETNRTGCEKSRFQFIVAGCDGAELLEFIKEPLDKVAL